LLGDYIIHLTTSSRLKSNVNSRIIFSSIKTCPASSSKIDSLTSSGTAK
jgi:hypothetical protein